MGRAGRGGGGLSSAHVVSNAAHADGARARADSRGWRGCPRAYTAHTTSTLTTYRIWVLYCLIFCNL
jgi:hypothetical protein